MGDPTELTATEQRRLLAAREVSARELLAAHLARIGAVDRGVNAIVALDPAPALARAEAIDAAVGRGDDLGPLAGLVTAHKDLTETADFPTTYGSPVFAGFRPTADSLLVSRMKEAGALAVGKTNTPEFGAGSHTFNPVYGLTRNPYDLERSAGGSSGGAAAALACGMVAIADGSDMGGSLRNPAAWCNVVGFRPSPGVVPDVAGPHPWSPLATAGPLGRCVADVALLLSVIGRRDVRDPLSHGVNLTLPLRPPDRPLRVGWSRDLGGLPIEAGQLAVLEGFRDVVRGCGWELIDAEPDLRGADETFLTLRAWQIATGPAGQLGARLERVKSAIRDEVDRGRQLSPQQIADAVNRLGVLRRGAITFFGGYDVLLAPVTQVAPFPVEWEYPDRIDGVELPTYTAWMASCFRITVLGTPSLSLPAGFDRDGRPVGIQVIARPGADGDVLRAALALESAGGFGDRRPDTARLVGAPAAGFGPAGHHAASGRGAETER